MIILIIAVIGLIGFVVYFILRQARTRQVRLEAGQTAQGEQLAAPCTIRIRRDSSQETEQMRKWQYAFALNGGEKQLVADGATIEFTTTAKNNALVGYGRSDYGGLSRHPALDSPFKFEAADGGMIELVAQPTFDYAGGNGKWHSNLRSAE